MLGLQITQTRHPKTVADRRTDGRTLLQLNTSWVLTEKLQKFKVPNKGPFVSTDSRTDGRSRPTTRPAFAKATQVKKI